MDEIPEITPDMVGCWLDGMFGWINSYRLIDTAETYGFELDEIYERPLLDKYGGFGLPAPSYDEAERIDAMAEDALEYLNDHAPAGYTFEYIGNELVLLPVCESEGFEPKFEKCEHCVHEREAAHRQLKREQLMNAEADRRHYRGEEYEHRVRAYIDGMRS